MDTAFLCVDFDPQATLSHSMGLSDVSEEFTVWGVMARDLIRETERMNAAVQGAESGAALPQRRLPASVTDMGLSDLRVTDFIKPTSWPTIDICTELRQRGLCGVSPAPITVT